VLPKGDFESVGIGIESFEGSVGHFFDGIDGSNFLGDGIEFVQERDHGRFVRNGYVDACEVGVFLKQKLRVGVGGFEEAVIGKDVFFQEFILEVSRGKRMG